MHSDILKTAFSGFSSKEALGMAFLRAWSSSFFSSALVFGAFSNSAGWGSLAHQISLVAFMVTFLAIGFTHRIPFFRRLLQYRKTAAALVVAGSACIVVTVVMPGTPSGVLVFGGIITGIGSASITTSWGAVFAAEESTTTAYGTTLGLYFFTTVFALAFSACTIPVLIAFSILSPVISVAYLSASNPPDWSKDDAADSEALPRNERMRLAGTLVYIVLTSVVIGAVGALCNDTKAFGLDATTLIVVAIIAISALACGLFGNIKIKALLTGTSLVLAVFLLVLPFGEGNPLVYVLGIAGKAHGWIVVWTFIILECSRVKKFPAMYVGLGMGAHYIGFLTGQGLVDVMHSFGTTEFHSYLFPFSLICMFLLVVSYLVAIATLQKDLDIEEEIAETDEAEANEGSDPESAMRPFDRKVALAAEHYGLTEREQEIMWHLAKGYSSKAIQTKLFISASTVSAHSGNIYRKMGVHSKEEVGEIVRSWEDPANENCSRQDSE